MEKNLKLNGENTLILEKLKNLMLLKQNLSFGKLIDSIFCPENICNELLTMSNMEVLERMDNMIEQYQKMSFKEDDFLTDYLPDYPENI
ncbi:MAG: hypothetical protein QXL18_01770 [Candidatus Woesearchaeota archaeon]